MVRIRGDEFDLAPTAGIGQFCKQGNDFRLEINADDMEGRNKPVLATAGTD
ncbi:MAG: hypothetical protein ISR72_10990 [Methylobacter sp.]|nr:hypothetical protein [Methylobacter sp.]